MTAIAQVIGWSFLIAALIGALIPGMHFHVVFAGDAAAQKFHAERAERLQKRIEEKAAKRVKEVA